MIKHHSINNPLPFMARQYRATKAEGEVFNQICLVLQPESTASMFFFLLFYQLDKVNLPPNFRTEK